MSTSGPFRTSQDLVNEVLAILGVLAPGQAVDPEDFDLVNNSLDSIFRKLAALEVCFVADANNIPGSWFRPLADIVAGEMATKFGARPDDFVQLLNAGLGGAQGVDIGFGAGAKALRAMLRGRPTGETQQILYF
jgi:hypothetical protein